MNKLGIDVELKSNISHNRWAIAKEGIEVNMVKRGKDGGRRLKKWWFQNRFRQLFWKNNQG